ncbi:MAG: glycosyltransferase [Chitinispirillaceae bacterium]|nr:glycosyltransferase [Chitinispirillaceae bacterium]
MAKIDMHVHSKFSKHPSEWFLQRIGTAESYTEPDFIYKTLLERSMDFVTITDHNQIEGAIYLKNLYPEKIIVGTEATAYFPEDGCKVHILIYDITENQFNQINILRNNIYELREYIIKNNIAYSVAHATFSVDGKLKTEHIEKLILLFDVFEAINGSRSKKQNEYWRQILTLLKKEEIEKLYEKHKIEPISDDPWIKGFTGGSDDHSGVFLGRTYTETEASTIEDFVKKLKEKKTVANGRHNDFLGLAFSIYKIAYEFSKTKNKIKIGSFFDTFNSIVFEKKKVSLIERLKLKFYSSRQKDQLKEAIIRLIENLNRLNLTEYNLDSNLDFIYKDIIDISDELMINFINTIKKGFMEANLSKIVKGASLALPASFLITPFLSSCKHLLSNLDLVVKLNENLGRESSVSDKKILWFTDTINDLNGVSTTLKTIGNISYKLGKELKIVVSLLPEEEDNSLPPNLINVKNISHFPLPFYEKIKIKIPSILSALKIIYDYQPDEIYISTPGPIGLLGLLSAKLLNVKSIGIYHTDFFLESKHIINDERIENLMEGYIRWFYNNISTVKVPTREYINILKERGYTRPLEIFERGIDIERFTSLQRKVKIPRRKKYNFFYVGRVSKDKGLDFLIDIHNDLYKEFKNFNLIIVGDGPFLKEMKEKTKHFDNIIYTGEVKHSEIPSLLKNADLFLFPSATDTFGMAVLEALSCGVPCIVSNLGGPKEIIEKTEGGFIAQAYNKEDWIKKIKEFLEIKGDKKEKVEEIIEKAKSNIIKNYSWEAALQKIF